MLTVVVWLFALVGFAATGFVVMLLLVSYSNQKWKRTPPRPNKRRLGR